MRQEGEILIPDPETGEYKWYKVYKEGGIIKVREQKTGKTEGVISAVGIKYYVVFTKPKSKVLDLETVKIDRNIKTLKRIEGVQSESEKSKQHEKKRTSRYGQRKPEKGIFFRTRPGDRRVKWYKVYTEEGIIKIRKRKIKKIIRELKTRKRKIKKDVDEYYIKGAKVRKFTKIRGHKKVCIGKYEIYKNGEFLKVRNLETGMKEVITEEPWEKQWLEEILWRGGNLSEKCMQSVQGLQNLVKKPWEWQEKPWEWQEGSSSGYTRRSFMYDGGMAVGGGSSSGYLDDFWHFLFTVFMGVMLGWVVGAKLGFFAGLGTFLCTLFLIPFIIPLLILFAIPLLFYSLIFIMLPVSLWWLSGFFIGLPLIRVGFSAIVTFIVLLIIGKVIG